MAWKHIFCVLLVSLLPVIPACHHQFESDGVYLDHLCVNPEVPTEKEKLPVIFLHGLSDRKETWSGIYQNVPFLGSRRVCIYSARNHGFSGWSDAFNIDVLAEDLGRFMRDKKIDKAAIVGHSMGGLTAMRFALKNPNKAERLFIEDIPVNIPKGVTGIIHYSMKVLKSSLSAIPIDADEEAALKAVGEYLFKALNITNMPSLENRPNPFLLHRVNGTWQWKMNIDVFIKSFEDVDSWLGKSEGSYDGKVFHIYGTASPFKVPDDKEAILKQFPNAEFFPVEGADHMIHGLYPVFLSELIKFLK